MIWGIGAPELIILLIIGLVVCGLPIAAVIVIVLLIRNQSSGRAAELQAENQRLRRQLDEQNRMPGGRE